MISEETTASDYSYAREAAFEQLLRLAVSCACAQSTASQPSASEMKSWKSPFSEDIAVRAYHIYLNRGAINGHDVDDWLEAEREVIGELKKNRASLRLALAFGLLKDFSDKNY
jgi:hypothetical protein